MRQRLTRKWRPPLSLVLGGSLAAVLVLPVLGVVIATLLAPSIGARWTVVFVSLGSGLATAILGYLLWRLILSPVQSLGARARDIRAGSPVTPLAHAGTPEVSEVADVVLDMAATLRAREMAVRAYADHVTHELRSPLAAIRGAAELLDGGAEDGEETQVLARTILAAEARAERLLNAAAEVVAARSPVHEGTCCLDKVDWDAGDLKVAQSGGNVVLPMAATGISLVLGHLARNAEEAGARGIDVTAGTGPGGVILTVADDGGGIAPGNEDRLFDPFFTTRRESGGTGMGLAIVQTLLGAHGAEIALVPGARGAVFEIRFTV